MRGTSKDISGLQGVLDMLEPKRMLRVARNTANQAATAFRTDAYNQIGKVFNIKAKRRKKDAKGHDTVRIKRAGRFDTSATVTFTWLRPNLRHFIPNDKMVNRKTGLKYRIHKGTSLRKIERGFFQTMKGPRALTPRRNAFQRVGKERWPVDTLTGPSLKQMYEDNAVFPVVEKKLTIHLERLFKEQFDKEYGGST